MSSAPPLTRRSTLMQRVYDAARVLAGKPLVYVTTTEAQEKVAGWLRPNPGYVVELEALIRQRIEARAELAEPRDTREAWLRIGRDAEARDTVKLFHALHRSIPAALAASQEDTDHGVN